MPEIPEGQKTPRNRLGNGAELNNRVRKGDKNWYRFFLDIQIKVPDGQPPIWQTPMFFALILGILLVIAKVVLEILKDGP